MKLLIISDMAHHHRDGRIVGWGAAVREINQVARLFDSVRHVACLHDGPAPDSFLPYESGNVELVPLRPTGGPGVRRKLEVIGESPRYLATILEELPRADVVHVRSPANIPLLAIGALALSRQPKLRWIKYAGNWKPDAPDSLSYRFQRWWIQRGFAGGFATINGTWVDQPIHVKSFVNPCLTRAELQLAFEDSREKSLSSPMRLAFVAHLIPSKGTERVVRIMDRLRRLGVAAELDVVGDGPERAAGQQLAEALGLGHDVRFLGALPRELLEPVYARSHFVVLPSSAEGWPKVLSEGMAHGCVPVASAVSCVPQYLRDFGTGQTCEVNDIDGYAKALADYAADPARWSTESRRAKSAASAFTYEEYTASIARLLGIE